MGGRTRQRVGLLIVVAVAAFCGAGSPGAVAQSRVLPPDAETGPAEVSPEHRVLLEAIIYPKGHYAWYWFQLGTTNRYGRTTERQVDEGRGAYGPETTNVFVCHFRPHTTYHYRLVVKNRSGKGYGRDRTFRTRSHYSSDFCY
jgi:hypothetical protein